MPGFDPRDWQDRKVEEVKEPELDEVGQVLMRAAACLRAYGWQQRDVGVDGEPRCAFGHILSATGVDSNVCKIGSAASVAATFFASCLPEPFKNGAGRVDIWNDAPGRTAEEVIAALEGAALSRAKQLKAMGE